MSRGLKSIKLLFIGSLVVVGSMIIFDKLMTPLTNSKIPASPNVKSMISEIKSDIMNEIADKFGDYVDEEKFNQSEAKDGEGRSEVQGYDGNWKTILLFHKISYLSKHGRYNHASPEELRKLGCPTWRCNFTDDRSQIMTADVLLWSGSSFKPKNINIARLPHQRWTILMGENPRSNPARSDNVNFGRHNLSYKVNWTMTYHSNADVSAYYGYFIAKDTTTMPLRPNLMSSHPETMKKYLEARSRNATLEEIMGPLWSFYVNRNSLVAWMSSHCGTLSRREEYVRQLSNYITVHKYGKCGDDICRPVWPNHECWRTTLGMNHLFYLSFENSLCDQYITEKLYMALIYNMVPIVYGGTPDYDLVLPPGSYINARHYMPQELAALLLRLKENPVEYGRYHLWRGFWEPRYGTSWCELCHKAHTDHIPKFYKSIPHWRAANGRCISVNSFNDTKSWKMG